MTEYLIYHRFLAYDQLNTSDLTTFFSDQY